MTRARTITMAMTTLALTLLVGCGSMGNMGDILGGGSNGQSYPGSQSNSIRGTVDNVDTRAQRIDLIADSYDGRGGSQRTSIYYDSRTRLTYRNQSGSPAGLERGDRIDVQVYNNNGQAVAETINVTQSVSDNNNSNYPNSGSYPNNGNYPNTYPSNSSTADLRGTVTNVDTRNQRIDIGNAYGTYLRNSQSNSNYTVFYDSRTRVLYRNESHQPTDLERGDEIEVRLVNSNSSQPLADTITVIRNVRQ